MAYGAAARVGARVAKKAVKKAVKKRSAKPVSEAAKKRALKNVNKNSTGVREFNAASARAAKRTNAKAKETGGARSRYSETDGRRMGPSTPGMSSRSENFVADAATARKLRLAKKRAAAATRRRRAKQGGATAGLSAAAVTARRRSNRGR